MIKLVFLDIDGVLNGHEWVGHAESTEIRPDCVARLNRILIATDARIVVSSAWRYMVGDRAMTLRGFDYLLRTHGVVADRVTGLTRRDTMIVGADGVERPLPNERGEQIADWLAQYGLAERYVVLDDGDDEGGDLGIGAHGHPFVRTDGKVGLTDADAERAIAILNGSTWPAALPSTELASCGCQVMRGWRCPMHDGP